MERTYAGPAGGFFLSLFFFGGDGVPTYPTSLGQWNGRCQNMNAQLRVKNLLTLGFYLRQTLDEIRHVHFDFRHVLCHLCMYTQNHWENCASNKTIKSLLSRQHSCDGGACPMSSGGNL